MKRTAAVYLTGAVLATGAYFYVPIDAQLSVYNAISVSAVVVMLFASWRHHPEPAAAWLLLAFGVMSMVAGELVWDSSETSPSIADMLYITGYPLVALGLIGLAPWSPRGRSGAAFASAGAVTIGSAVFGWAFLVLPNSGGEQVELMSRVVAASYPVLDLILVALLMRAVSRGMRDMPATALALAILAMFAGDAAYAVESFGADYAVGSWVDATWLVSYALFGVAPLVARGHQAYDAAYVETGLGYAIPRNRPSVDGGVAVLERAETHTVSRTVHHVLAQDLRFGVVLLWSGRMLLGLGILAVLGGAQMQAMDIVMTAGAYAFTGVFLTIVGTRATSA